MQQRNSWISITIATVAFMTLFGLIGVDDARAQDEKDADVIVQFSAQNVATRAITFTTPVSGLRALELSGLEYESFDFGGGFIAVCRIEGVGCPATAEECFCGGNTFWGYSFWDGNQWQGYETGAATSVISQTGAIEGWRWGEFGAALATPANALAAQRALNQVRATQESNGGYGSASATSDVMLAIGANLIDSAAWTTEEGTSLIDYWTADDIDEDEFTSNAERFAKISPAGAGKLLLAATATGADPTSFAGLNLPQLVNANYDANSGSFGPTSWDQALSMLGLAAVREDALPRATVDALAASVNEDGSWDYLPDGAGDSNSTALVIQALRAAGECRRSPLITDGLAYIKRTQNADGGFGFTPDSETDANSTAYVVLALLAADQDPDGTAWSVDGKTPLDALRDLQLPDGTFEWIAGDGANPIATQQAIPALLRTPFVAADDQVDCTELYLPAVTNGAE
jgi:hypothetical protein